MRESPKPYALVVLDLMLPGAYGLDVLKKLRSSGSSVPVLVLSARNDTRDKVRALQLGADDFVTKPFWPEELLARVKARLRGR
jgi:two-component system response regulator MtrA